MQKQQQFLIQQYSNQFEFQQKSKNMIKKNRLGILSGQCS